MTLRPRPAQVRHRDGAPLAIERIIGKHPDGTPITAGDRLIQVIRLGEFVQVALHAAGLDKTTWIRLQRTAATLEYDLSRGARREHNLTKDEQLVRAFYNRYLQAEADALVRHAEILDRLVEGATITTVTRTERIDKDGAVTVETRTETKPVGPDPQTVRWRMSIRWPQFYSQKIQLAGDPRDIGDALTPEADDEAMAELREAAERLAALRAGAIETTGT
jgi:hypothetical protein